jgi:ABC-type multidrug transport system fused ATPase/permease subunit
VSVYKEQRPPWLFWFYPFFVFYRAVYVMWTACYGAISADETVSYFACPTSLALDSELTLAFIVMAAHAVVFFVLAVYLDAVLPTKGFGVPPAHPLLCLHREQSCVRRPRDRARDYDEDLDDKIQLHEESVQAEKDRVLRGDVAEAAVVVANLCKRFKKKRGKDDSTVHAHLREWAVDHMYLTIDKGECFGLLGENGAGKTTAISMLTGLLEATAGTALFEGYNLRNRQHMQQIHKLIGIG